MLKGFDDFMTDTQERGHVVGTWGFHSNVDFTRMRPEETNVWFFEQTFNFLRAFFGLVLQNAETDRAFQVNLNSYCWIYVHRNAITLLDKSQI